MLINSISTSNILRINLKTSFLQCLFSNIYSKKLFCFALVHQLTAEIENGSTRPAWAGDDPCRNFSSKYSIAYGCDKVWYKM